ncbi:hypothetical protein BJY00DRAFT_312834 [Aspergillus carlsbadensis]|nr:hypothetical protein BJY00DRAFT_312834 [Aspergillus carlsbadensis]
MADTGLIKQLGASIQGASIQLHEHLQQLGHPSPTFDADTPIHVLPSSAPQEAHLLRHRLKQEALALFRLVSGPDEYIAHISLHHQYTICLRYLSYFQIFQHVPFEIPITFAALAEKAQVPLPQLAAILRMATTSGLFVIPSPNTVTHSAVSRLIAKQSSAAAWATCISQLVFDASCQLNTATERWGSSPGPVHSPFNLAFRADVPFGQYLGQNPDVARVMGEFVQATGMVDANDIRHMVTGYAWEQLGSAKIFDVGSTSISLSEALARAFPQLSFEIIPQTRAATRIETGFETLDKDLRRRIQLKGPGFIDLAEVAAAAAEAAASTDLIDTRTFVLHHVLHNLPNPICQSILTHLSSALRHETDRILILDLVLPESNELDPYDEAMLGTRAMIQLELANARVRGRGDWEALAQTVEPGLRILNLSRPVGSDLAILEIGLGSL